MENTFVLTNDDVARIRLALISMATDYESKQRFEAAQRHFELAESFLSLNRPADGSREYAQVTIAR